MAILMLGFGSDLLALLFTNLGQPRCPGHKLRKHTEVWAPNKPSKTPASEAAKAQAGVGADLGEPDLGFSPQSPASPSLLASVRLCISPGANVAQYGGTVLQFVLHRPIRLCLMSQIHFANLFIGQVKTLKKCHPLTLSCHQRKMTLHPTVEEGILESSTALKMGMTLALCC